MNNKIIKRVYYAIKVELASPICVSGSTSILTDKDVIRNGKNEFFIPGTSIAGALRTYMQNDNIRKQFVGFSDINDGRMSSLFISDLFFNKPVISKRDGTKLTDEKRVDNKFDMEIAETGSEGTMYLNYIVRKEGDEAVFNSTMERLIYGIECGAIRFGANKNRGFGRLKITDISIKEFSSVNVDEYIEFEKTNITLYKTETFDEWKSNKQLNDDRYVKIVVPLKLSGGISIRRYSTELNEADYEQITIHKKDSKNNCTPVIPGTSWNGAIRKDVLRIMKELGDKQADDHVGIWFGFTELDKPIIANNKAQQSLVVFGESLLDGSEPIKIMRNKIDRFDASTIDMALYTEKSNFQGNTNLEIMVRKDDDASYKALVGGLLIAINDILEGYVAVGGLTSVGRGLFIADGDIKVDGNKLDDDTKETYLKELYAFISCGGNYDNR